LLGTLPHPAIACAVAMSGDASRLCVSCYDGSLTLWVVLSGQRLLALAADDDFAS
jgi:hypothetical protein